MELRCALCALGGGVICHSTSPGDRGHVLGFECGSAMALRDSFDSVKHEQPCNPVWPLLLGEHAVGLNEHFYDAHHCSGCSQGRHHHQ